PPVSQLGRLDGGVPPAIVLAQGRAEGLHGLLDGAGIGCHDRPRGMGPRAEPGPLYHTTARRRRQGRALQLSASAGVPTGTAAGGSRERPLSLDLPQRPGANGALAAGSREIISSAFLSLTLQACQAESLTYVRAEPRGTTPDRRLGIS